MELNTITIYTLKNTDFGLYYHIPFCAQICNYCDFPKTRKYSDETISDYIEILKSHTHGWIEFLTKNSTDKSSPKFSSVFFGGGTPGLLSDQYTPLFAAIRSYLDKDCEISLEANVNNINERNLHTWKDLGFNRLSIGVQSFNPLGLKTLSRTHSKDDAIAAINIAKKYFNNVNIDIIFGWPGQTISDLEKDIYEVIQLEISHLSLYCLTLEKKTKLTRDVELNRVEALDDDTLSKYYEHARNMLKATDFIHEEVSNWTLPNKSCKHNWLYWQAGPYLGIGAGAHGFLNTDKGIGERYSYESNINKFLKSAPPTGLSILDSIESSAAHYDERDCEAWLLEYIGCSLRSYHGINLELIKKKTGHIFHPTINIKNGIQTGKLKINGDILKLDQSEWFRETGWALELVLSHP